MANQKLHFQYTRLSNKYSLNGLKFKYFKNTIFMLAKV